MNLDSSRTGSRGRPWLAAGEADPIQARLRLAVLTAMGVAHGPVRLQDQLEREGLDCESLLDFAVENDVGPIVAHAFRQLDIQGPARVEADAVHEESARRIAVLMEVLDSFASRLAQAGIPLVALKNAGIARGLYPCAACCPMGDIDVLVPRLRFREAHRLLLEQGFELATRSTVEPADVEAGLVGGGTEYVKQVGGEEVWLELQWRPVAGRWIRPDQEPDGEELIARSVPIEGSDVRLLAPEDNMLQVALHTAKHSYVRAPGLRLHTDVDRLTAFAPPDWSVVVRRARELEVRTAVYFSLAFAKTLLGTPVPDWVLEDLAPPRWKVELVSRWVRHVDVFEPDAPKFTRPGMMAFHALLYDTPAGLLASAMGTTRRGLSHDGLAHNLSRGARRMFDLVSRYERR